MTIATDDFTGTDGDLLNGRTTTTGGLTWASTGWQINANRAYNASAGAAMLNSGITDHIVSFVIKVHDFNIMIFRSNSGGTTKLEVWPLATTITIYDESVSQIAQATGLTIANNDTISVECNGTSIVVKQNGTTRLTTTSSHGASGTYVGMRGTGDEINDDFSVSAFAIAAPTATLTRATPTQVELTSTAGAGGTSPQWSRSTSAGSGFSNLSNGSGISGATSADLVDGSSGIAAGTRYYYKVTYATSGASNVQAAGKWKIPAYVMFIGDSITTGFGGTTDPVAQFAISAKKSANGQRDVIASNQGESGTKTSDWYDAAGAGAASRLTAASSAGISAGCTHAMICLGINDAYSAETVTEYENNLAGMASTLLSGGYTAVIINYPTGITEDGTGALDKLVSLQTHINNVVNGTTILLGDTLMLYYLQDHTVELQDSTGVHPNDTGYRSVGEAWAWAWARAVGDTESIVSPDEGDVRIGIQYGASGTEFTGTLLSIPEKCSASRRTM